VFAASPILPQGAARLLGPTGGYLMSYPVAAFVTGWLAERGFDRRYFTACVAMLCGLTVVFAGGVSWLALAVPPGRVTRPTSDRAKEGLFASVLATLGSLAGASVLDLYAGSGAVGLEALSRGAASVLLVESDARAAEVIRRNIAAVGLSGARLVCDRVDRALRRGATGHGLAGSDLPEHEPPTQAARQCSPTRPIRRLTPRSRRCC
jgi:hypothetical protein